MPVKIKIGYVSSNQSINVSINEKQNHHVKEKETEKRPYDECLQMMGREIKG